MEKSCLQCGMATEGLVGLSDLRLSTCTATQALWEPCPSSFWGEKSALRHHVLLNRPEPRLQPPPAFLGLEITQANSSNLA